MIPEPTRYEIAASHGDGRRYVVAYTPRVSRPGLREALTNRRALIATRCEGITAKLAYLKRDGRWTATSGAWTFGFTGRTQRDARSAGLLPSLEAASFFLPERP